MNGKQILGQLLLWAGFISAALASVCQLEFDLLDECEREVLDSLPAAIETSKFLTEWATEKRLNELNFKEFQTAVDFAKAQHDLNEESTTEDATEDEPKPENEAEPANEAEQEAESKKLKPYTKADFVKARTSQLNTRWPTVKWLWYGVSIAVGLAGVVLLRSSAKAVVEDKRRVDADFSIARDSLSRLKENTDSFGKQLETMKPRESVEFIDDQLAEDFSSFAEARNSLTQKFGLENYAEIMTQFASAERFINRTWSASADGYMQEARDCVARARQHLATAVELLENCDREQA